MKLLVTVTLDHDVLDVATLLGVLPSALASVQAATSAGIAETGPDGIRVQPSGLDALVRVRFKIEAQETVRRLDQLAVTPETTATGLPLTDGPSERNEARDEARA